MNGRVRRLQVNTTGVDPRDCGTLQQAEGFARNVLALFCEIVEDRFPGQEVRIRRVDLRCSLSAGQLAGPAEVSRCAQELAAAIDIGSDVVSADADPDTETETGFANAWSTAFAPAASQLLPHQALNEVPVFVEAVDQPPPAQPRLRPEGDPWEIVPETMGTGRDYDTARAFAAEVELLTASHRSGTVEAWLNPSPEVAGRTMRRAAPARRQIMIAALLKLSAANEMFEILERLTPATLAVLLEVLEVEPHVRARARHERWEQRRSDEAALGQAGPPEFDDTWRPDARTQPPPGEFPPTPRPDLVAVVRHIQALANQQAGGRLSQAEPADPAGSPASATWNASPPHRGAIAEEPAAPPLDLGVRTGFGGLFYLLSPALELGIGEALWKACLPEGQILSRAAACLLGEPADGDVAAALFGGATVAETAGAPVISTEQQQDVCAEMLDAFVAACRRVGAEHLPVPVLDVLASSAGRLLVAQCDVPAPIFVWPAPDAAAVTAGIETFLRHWPADAEAPLGCGALADFDRSARLRRAPGSARSAGSILPQGTDAAASCVLTQILGGLLTLFHTRLMAHGDAEATGLVARYLAVPARVVLAPEAMTILLPMDRIDLALRRAGLDRDPGWVPWLRRTVRFEFEPVGPGEVL
jgi:hypothetical protein